MKTKVSKANLVIIVFEKNTGDDSKKRKRLTEIQVSKKDFTSTGFGI